MSYKQHMKHWRNHRKDKSVQQCSGYSGNGVSHQLSEEQFKRLEITSFMRLIEEAKALPFPVYVACSGGYYYFTAPNHLTGAKIENYQDLIQFGKDYVSGFGESRVPLDKKLVAAKSRQMKRNLDEITDKELDSER